MTAVTVTEVHISCKGSADPKVVAPYIVGMVRHVKADHFTTTECSKRAIVRSVRRSLGPTWKVARTGEYLEGWKRDTFTRQLAAHLWVVTKILSITWRNTRVSVRRLVLPNGRRYRSVVGHFPSAVQSAGRWSPNRLLVLASQTAFRLVGASQARFLARHPNGVAVTRGDFNIGFQDDSWRTWAEGKLHATCIWSVKQASIGTEGSRRVIDAGFVSGPAQSVTKPHVVTRGEFNYPAAIDHKAVTWTLTA